MQRVKLLSKSVELDGISEFQLLKDGSTFPMTTSVDIQKLNVGETVLMLTTQTGSVVFTKSVTLVAIDGNNVCFYQDNETKQVLAVDDPNVDNLRSEIGKRITADVAVPSVTPQYTNTHGTAEKPYRY